uniref:(northern house mosquito) hypothetical protein n=1 Tax=Culex pipiens TaxID=7175 RepID=A0A8D8A011_CULPI
MCFQLVNIHEQLPAPAAPLVQPFQRKPVLIQRLIDDEVLAQVFNVDRRRISVLLLFVNVFNVPQRALMRSRSKRTDRVGTLVQRTGLAVVALQTVGIQEGGATNGTAERTRHRFKRYRVMRFLEVCLQIFNDTVLRATRKAALVLDNSFDRNDGGGLLNRCLLILSFFFGHDRNKFQFSGLLRTSDFLRNGRCLNFLR